MKNAASISFFFLLLTSLACSLSGGMSGTSNSIKNEAVLIPRPTAAPLYFVCTGTIAGSLNVRDCPGVECQPISAIREGTPVNLTGNASWQDASQWVELSTPVTGWVNARYLCQQP